MIMYLDECVIPAQAGIQLSPTGLAKKSGRHPRAGGDPGDWGPLARS